MYLRSDSINGVVFTTGAVGRNYMDDARKLTSETSMPGEDGIPRLQEIEFELTL